MKYIVMAHEGAEYMVLFPRHELTHKYMAEAVQHIRCEGARPGDWSRDFIDSKIVSAGFVDASGHCHGHSESLGIGSRPEDTKLLQSQYT